MPESTVLLARQAILNRQGHIEAYSILYPDNKHSDIESSNSLLHSLITDLDLDIVTNNTKAFIDISIDVLLKPPAFSLDNYVLFFKAPSPFPDSLIEHISLMHEDGYKLGLINAKPDSVPLEIMPFISYIKFNLKEMGIRNTIKLLEDPFYKDACLLASQINLSQHNDAAQQIPKISLFSGNFHTAKEDVHGKKAHLYKALVIEFLAKINESNSNIFELASIIEKDATLAYKVIKLTKRAPSYQNFQVSSVQRALEVIGLRDVMKWFSMAIFNSIDGKPDCLCQMALTRAIFCQQLAKTLYPNEPHAFIVGLFSYLPSFFGEPIEKLLNDIPLNDNLVQALSKFKGPLGNTLKVVQQYERGQWDDLPLQALSKVNLDKARMRDMYIESIKQAKELQYI
ncbi:putative signal transduction protein containing EAL and modified HD-GYP domains [Marinomonas sp. MED121]|uniref:EAL and HDOD domain-containing protein n=1 Tax=Marinomonas sp. MED121 TaxID=314277 RepID=UPI0000690B9A|nr:HDOD domain-containing protein [Marinomonas sp. MED121]EAQ65909.1 putative signal transduction protein containing EAL and modified HD-GYP domains [Marinomonas sp. MED121]